jgi:hypothetical protein
VGGALVPAILPVTGAVPTDTLLLWLLSGLLLLGLGRAAFCGLRATVSPTLTLLNQGQATKED